MACGRTSFGLLCPFFCKGEVFHAEIRPCAVYPGPVFTRVAYLWKMCCKRWFQPPSLSALQRQNLMMPTKDREFSFQKLLELTDTHPWCYKPVHKWDCVFECDEQRLRISARPAVTKCEIHAPFPRKCPPMSALNRFETRSSSEAHCTLNNLSVRER